MQLARLLVHSNRDSLGNFGNSFRIKNQTHNRRNAGNDRLLAQKRMPLGINDTINTQGQSHGELLEGHKLYQRCKKNARKKRTEDTTGLKKWILRTCQRGGSPKYR